MKHADQLVSIVICTAGRPEVFGAALQSVLGQEVITDIVDRHGFVSQRMRPGDGYTIRLGPAPKEAKWGLLLPGAPEPRLMLLRHQGFRSVFQTAYAA